MNRVLPSQTTDKASRVTSPKTHKVVDQDSGGITIHDGHRKADGHV